MTDSEKARINARIDRVAEAQLRYVTEHTQMNISDALRASIALLYDKVSREHIRPAELLARGPNFVAAGEGPDDSGSSDYKSLLVESVAGKL
ncbi:MAG: hypothetical protein KDI37_03700 [Xanthomonadales bacterium]|nr:hypothetical protein [Xanthomonadales bacterium]MCB1635765.1 hypothetical protein [Xanthomonadales bacterium]MCB1640811.1 hypothetical protein [Xanthomonadales bacterium]